MSYTFRPLGAWPDKGTPYWERRSRHTFKASWSDTLYLLESELDKLTAHNIVIQADFREGDLRLDGMPKSNARQPDHPGVIVNFESKFGPLRYLTDTHEFWQHNVRGIALGLQALRAVDRYGVTKRGEQYTGWRQLTAGSGITSQEAARELLTRLADLDDPAADMATAYRQALMKAHPDHGGNTDTFSQVRDAGRILGVAS